MPRSTFGGLYNDIGLFYGSRYIFQWFMQIRTRQDISVKGCSDRCQNTKGKYCQCVKGLSAMCGFIGTGDLWWAEWNLLLVDCSSHKLIGNKGVCFSPSTSFANKRENSNIVDNLGVPSEVFIGIHCCIHIKVLLSEGCFQLMTKQSTGAEAGPFQRDASLLQQMNSAWVVPMDLQNLS